ncbi:sodium-dependent bicarbonate transport family permease [Polaribacter litorisediminis]|uniref:sodium-dependent bicarbonate transport family permease n=1 Tax=Polaribacter litorisediminis TaxID=1908341 RepID=UPI001CBEFE17|nr:sodium-dependent bicarbonate transport family permease [Polaribacter litorisediminis]UAM98063.1 sodium-dependent bicarbonate transport family permease [Polaribacter litorisediminis]
MSVDVLISNLTNPVLLFFVLGIIASLVKSDLKIPESSSKFISLYLLFAIGFKGGQELSHSEFNAEIIYSILFAIGLSVVVPLYTFYILKRKIGTPNAGAIAAAYGSVSAVTFVTAVSFLENQGVPFGGHMVAIMAIMESPAIIVGVILIMLNDNTKKEKKSIGGILKHSFTSGSVLMLIGSLMIGLIADASQARGIEPFTTDIFKGFLSLFLLEMGMVTASRIKGFKKHGMFLFFFGIMVPLFNGMVVAYVSGFLTESEGNRLLFAILAAGASYIAVPATMKLAEPRADAGIYIPMALGITFPFNITIGMPIYYAVVQLF